MDSDDWKSLADWLATTGVGAGLQIYRATQGQDPVTTGPQGNITGTVGSQTMLYTVGIVVAGIVAVLIFRK
jgi:hypothetical protein